MARTKSRTAAFAALASLGALAACATTGGHEAQIDRNARAQAERQDSLAQMTFWAQEYQRFPDDLEAAQKFSEALREGGRADRAVQVAAEGLQKHPQDKTLTRTLGLALIRAGRPADAVRPLAWLAQQDAQDWRARSALGVALDQIGRHPEARASYREALTISPNEMSVLINMGVSHIYSGEPAEAERILKQAAEAPNATAEARQNLALAIALQGRFDEAERLQRVDLPPTVVAANMAYLRGLFSDPRRWAEMRGSSSAQ